MLTTKPGKIFSIVKFFQFAASQIKQNATCNVVLQLSVVVAFDVVVATEHLVRLGAPHLGQIFETQRATQEKNMKKIATRKAESLGRSKGPTVCDFSKKRIK
mmetsp:Transcript_37196/g.59967  ORF Transcript_37196/g.59967 Transcript_37196/m.59967 type:complete len:102 (-) Transcript_37196:62-367(-)